MNQIEEKMVQKPDDISPEFLTQQDQLQGKTKTLSELKLKLQQKMRKEKEDDQSGLKPFF